MTRLHQIRDAVQQLSTRTPEVETAGSGTYWYKPDRGSADYYRLVVDSEPMYDVWLETDAGFDQAGVMQVSVEVVLFNVQLHMEEERDKIIGDGFDGNNQPCEQAFLLNVHHYEQQARDVVERYAEQAEVLATEVPSEPAPTPA